MRTDDRTDSATGPLPVVFGRLEDGRTVERYVLSNEHLEVGVLTWGATVQSLRVPDRDGVTADIVLGFDDLDSYVAHTEYFGATVGRYANRLAHGRFRLNGEEFTVPANDAANALHGGPVGFDRHVWEAQPYEGTALTLTRVSPHGEMGFPGELTVAVTYELRGAALSMKYEATTDRPTVVNLTNHAYFNLAGSGSGSVEGHELRLASSGYLPVDAGAIPLGQVAPVEGTPMDFRVAKPIGQDLRAGFEQLRQAGGYDHCFVLDRDEGAPPIVAAVVTEASTGRSLEISTDEPGVQLYSGNFLDGTFVGKGGRTYRQTDAFCLETQHFPDAPNRPEFPSTVLRPGERFASTTAWRFGTL